MLQQGGAEGATLDLLAILPYTRGELERKSHGAFFKQLLLPRRQRMEQQVSLTSVASRSRKTSRDNPPDLVPKGRRRSRKMSEDEELRQYEEYFRTHPGLSATGRLPESWLIHMSDQQLSSVKRARERVMKERSEAGESAWKKWLDDKKSRGQMTPTSQSSAYQDGNRKTHGLSQEARDSVWREWKVKKDKELATRKAEEKRVREQLIAETLNIPRHVRKLPVGVGLHSPTTPGSHGFNKSPDGFEVDHERARRPSPPKKGPLRKRMPNAVKVALCQSAISPYLVHPAKPYKKENIHAPEELREIRELSWALGAKKRLSLPELWKKRVERAKPLLFEQHHTAHLHHLHHHGKERPPRTPAVAREGDAADAMVAPPASSKPCAARPHAPPPPAAAAAPVAQHQSSRGAVTERASAQVVPPPAAQQVVPQESAEISPSPQSQVLPEQHQHQPHDTQTEEKAEQAQQQGPPPSAREPTPPQQSSPDVLDGVSSSPQDVAETQQEVPSEEQPRVTEIEHAMPVASLPVDLKPPPVNVENGSESLKKPSSGDDDYSVNFSDHEEAKDGGADELSLGPMEDTPEAVTREPLPTTPSAAPQGAVTFEPVSPVSPAPSAREGHAADDDDCYSVPFDEADEAETPKSPILHFDVPILETPVDQLLQAGHGLPVEAPSFKANRDSYYTDDASVASEAYSETFDEDAELPHKAAGRAQPRPESRSGEPRGLNTTGGVGGGDIGAPTGAGAIEVSREDSVVSS